MKTYNIEHKKINAFHGYKPLPGMVKVHKSKALVDFINGGYRAGKTYGVAKDVIDRVTEKDGNVWAVVRQHFTDITKPGGVIDTYKLALRDIEGIVLRPYHGTDHYITLRSRDGGECRLLFASGEDPLSFGSTAFGGAHIIEAQQCREALLDMMLSRCSLTGVTHKIFLDFNPTDQFHWLYKRAIVQANEDTAYHQLTTFENEEAGGIPAGYCERLIRQKGESWASRYLYGNWGFTGEGEPVFPMFRRDRHLVDHKPDPSVPALVGIDFGFRRPAAVIAQMRAGVMVVHDAILGEDQTIEQFADVIQERLKALGLDRAEWWGDAAGNQVRDTDGDSAMGILSRRGIHVQGEKHRITAGLDVMRSLLTQTTGNGDFRLSFHKGCADLMLYGMEGGYHYPEKAKQRENHTDPLPEKDGVYDHLMDALRYLVAGVFGLDVGADVTRNALAQIAVSNSLNYNTKAGQVEASFDNPFALPLPVAGGLGAIAAQNGGRYGT